MQQRAVQAAGMSSKVCTQEKERLLLRAGGKRTQLMPAGYTGGDSIRPASLFRTLPTRLSTEYALSQSAGHGGIGIGIEPAL